VTTRKSIATSFDAAAVYVRRAMEVLWLLTLLLVPLIFTTSSVMSFGYDVPKVTLYRTLVGLIAALWIIEWGLTLRPARECLPSVTWTGTKRWLLAHPSRWILLAACTIFVANLISTLLSPSIAISFWGREPALDGYGFYNTLAHFALFAALATHVKTEWQVWRLLGVIVASGVLVGLYGILQGFGLDPFAVPTGPVISSLGNPIFAASFLIMVAPLAIAFGLKSGRVSSSTLVNIPWVAALTILLLTIFFTHARGPWVGLVIALAGFFVLALIALGWRASVRAGAILVASLAIAWTVITLVPTPAGGQAGLTPVVSIAREVSSALTAQSSNGPSPSLGQDEVAPADSIAREASGPLTAQSSSGPDQTTYSSSSTLRTRFLIWKGAGQLALHRPWFEFEDRPFPLSLHLFGYGPELFQYVFSLQRPPEFEVWEGRRAQEAHNNAIHIVVELGLFGLGSYFFLLGALAATAVVLLVRRRAISTSAHRLVLIALLASLAGRTAEQLVGIAHMSDLALFWALLGVMVALPQVRWAPVQQSGTPEETGINGSPLSPSRGRARGTASTLSLALVLASVVVAFTLVKNPYYALAENKATVAESMLKQGDVKRAAQQIDHAIALAPNVSRYQCTRARILDQVRSTTSEPMDRWRLAQETYLATQKAVESNPFEIIPRFQRTQAALTLAQLGQPSMGQEAIEQSQRLTWMVPRFWPSHFLLATTYQELGQPELAIKSFDATVQLNPQLTLAYNQRGIAYADLGRYRRAVEDYNEAIRLNPGFASTYNHRGIASFQMGELERAIEDFNQALQIDPQFTQALANRALVNSLLNSAAELHDRD